METDTYCTPAREWSVERCTITFRLKPEGSCKGGVPAGTGMVLQ